MKRFVARCTPWGTIQTGDLFHTLTAVERAAVMAHETAHLMNRDPWIRLWWLVSLRWAFDPEWVCEQCRLQELAADQYVKQMGLVRGLRSFLSRYPSPPGDFHPGSKERLEALRG